MLKYLGNASSRYVRHKLLGSFNLVFTCYGMLEGKVLTLSHFLMSLV